MGKVTIEVEEQDIGRIEERVVELLVRDIERRAGAKLLEEAQRIATEQLRTTLTERIESAAKDLLDKGWQEMSTWGEPTGQTWTLRGHVVAMMQREEGQYSDRAKMIDRTIKKVLDERLRTEFDDVFKEAREKFQAAVNGIVKEKLAETLKGALGLR